MAGRLDRRSEAARLYRTWYSTPRWRSLRQYQLTRAPTCARCQARGVTTKATVAHHITAHKGDYTLFWDINNLASSCANCHDIDEQRLERGGKARQAVGDDGWPI